GERGGRVMRRLFRWTTGAGSFGSPGLRMQWTKARAWWGTPWLAGPTTALTEGTIPQAAVSTPAPRSVTTARPARQDRARARRGLALRADATGSPLCLLVCLLAGRVMTPFYEIPCCRAATQ